MCNLCWGWNAGISANYMVKLGRRNRLPHKRIY
jgi:hypothetical protein